MYVSTISKEFLTGGEDSLPAVSRPEAMKEFSLLLLHPHQHFHQTSPVLNTQLYRLVSLHEYIVTYYNTFHIYIFYIGNNVCSLSQYLTLLLCNGSIELITTFELSEILVTLFLSEFFGLCI